jgi:hypothetical protein
MAAATAVSKEIPRPILATPESRRGAVLEALREAIDICVGCDALPDERTRRLAKAEDRFNRTLALQVVEACHHYAPRILDEKFLNRPCLCIGDDPDRTPMKVLRDGSIRYYDLLTGIERGSPCIDDFVVLARSSCHTLAPRSYLLTTSSYPLRQGYTGRHPADEARMWSSWWTACVDGLATNWDALIDDAGPSPAPFDACFCKGGLILARFLLDIGARRADQDVRGDRNFQRNWEVSATGRAQGPAPPRAWILHEQDIHEMDHERCHWAAMCKRDGDDYLTQRVRVRLDRWHLARAMLVVAVAFLERLYNTHAIYDALGICALEATVLERHVPPSIFDPVAVTAADPSHYDAGNAHTL